MSSAFGATFFVFTACIGAITLAENAVAFEGRIEIVITLRSETTPLLYTVGPNSLRIEVTGSEKPNPIDLVDLKSRALTILFPHNRSFVRLSPGRAGGSPAPPTPQMPAMPPGVGPQSPGIPAGAQNVPPDSVPGGKMPARPMPQMPAMPPGVGPQSGAGAGMPQMPMMPAMPPMGEKMELKATGKKEKLLGFNCEQYEIKQRGETMEIWATDQLFSYQPYVRKQQPRFGPRMIEEHWPDLLTEKKLFPLRVILRVDRPRDQTAGTERFRFEVKSVKPEKIDEKDLFQPPPNYIETRPLPF